ncbi:Pyruvate kinase [Candidatus Clavichlamydia salmonicola]|uniref:pyruvate kinase n=1 Tax=Candidatus Clavichlamydia salmonicola TaxID=469812 RepID=UPI001891F2AD|nr:pyruvate kinase [Candidatus Clavichlamydia salmonicola]MBF5051224.1 Pyruvate kinase [Candidatus Clavichlamydia salmonicola]
MFSHTKIVCTLGPAVADKQKIIELIDAGMNVARLNFSHGDYETHGNFIRLIKEIRESLSVPLAILLDTKGPEIRLGHIKDNKISVNNGDRIKLVKKDVEGTCAAISLTPSDLIDCVTVGTQVLIDNGYILAHVIATEEGAIELEIDHGGVISSRKSLTFKGVEAPISFLTEKDKEDIIFGCAQDIDWIAASFVRCGQDISSLRDLVEKEGKPAIKIMAKIEHPSGLENFQDIVLLADGIMVARGDLGVETSLVEVPIFQKRMLKSCLSHGKTSVTATQMLESMITNPIPTRAEISDVANAVCDHTSAVMLSAETAAGNYPKNAVMFMKNTIIATEKEFLKKDHYENPLFFKNVILPSQAILSALDPISSAPHIKAIIVFTKDGFLPRQVSGICLAIPIIAVTDNEQLFHQMALERGILPCLIKDSGCWKKSAVLQGIRHHIMAAEDYLIILEKEGTPDECDSLFVKAVGDLLI